MKAVRAERVVLGVVGFILLFIVVCPPFEYRGRWVHLWLREGLRLAAEWEARFCSRLLLIELAAAEVVVGVTLLAACAHRNGLRGARLTRRQRIVLVTGLAVLALLLFPPFRIRTEGHRFMRYVAHRFVTTPQVSSDLCRFSEVHVRLLAAELGVVVVAGGALALFFGKTRAKKHQP